MIGLRNKAVRAATFAVLLVILRPALAHPLRPEGTDGLHPLAGETVRSLPKAGDATSSPETAQPPGREVTVHVLGAVEGPPAGTLTAGGGGLGSDLWSGTPKLEAEALLDGLPIATTIAPLRALARRLLLTTAAAPIGTTPHAFITVRLRRLLDAGLVRDAGVLALVAQVAHDPDFDRARADALLYANQVQAVCGPDTALRLHSSAAFWIRLRAYCYSAQGNMPAAQLTLSVMQAQGLSDPAFTTLLADLRSHTARMPDKIEDADSLTVFLLTQNGLPVSLDLGEELGTPGLLLAARAAKNAPADRIDAAERVVRTGALSASELQSIADAQDFTADQLATEHAQVLQMPFLEGQALLRQAVRRASQRVQPALIYEALTSAQSKDLMEIAADLEQDALMRLEPDARDRQMTDVFARALMMTGLTQRAMQWAATLNPALPSDAPVWARLYASLELIAPAAIPAVQRRAMLNELSREVVQKTPEQGFAALALGLYAALKEPLPPSVALVAKSALQIRWPGRRPTPAYMQKLEAAMHAPNQRGAAIAFILDAMGAQGPAELAPDACAGLVGDLVQEHLNAEARAIATFALLNFTAPSLTGAALQAKGSASL